jgi:hypothetical protein
MFCPGRLVVRITLLREMPSDKFMAARVLVFYQSAMFVWPKGVDSGENADVLGAGDNT